MHVSGCLIVVSLFMATTSRVVTTIGNCERNNDVVCNVSFKLANNGHPRFFKEGWTPSFAVIKLCTSGQTWGPQTANNIVLSQKKSYLWRHSPISYLHCDVIRSLSVQTWFVYFSCKCPTFIYRLWTLGGSTQLTFADVSKEALHQKHQQPQTARKNSFLSAAEGLWTEMGRHLASTNKAIH